MMNCLLFYFIHILHIHNRLGDGNWDRLQVKAENMAFFFVKY